ncbi:hypothetical protein U8V72_23215 [Priestia filamentosa]|uniref:hypothetical protein n=1 Tax=Priestia filamentosa TaxID=1402861 RepID=UPI0005892D80
MKSTVNETVKEELLERVKKFVKESKFKEDNVYDNGYIVENKYEFIDELYCIVEYLLDDSEEVEKLSDKTTENTVLKRVVGFLKTSNLKKEDEFEDACDNDFIIENKYSLVGSLIEMVSHLIDDDEEVEK